jgi:2-dehydro-3-deoxyphosphogluconate aldolase/(4S)-4-hydroxy-2-oxoglutarate aldolase
MTTPFNQELFNKMPIVGIMRNFPEQYLSGVVTAMTDAGLTTLEITMNSSSPGGTIRSLREQWGERMNIGAGTVITKKDLDAALDAGAQFIVTPILSKAVIKACVKRDIPVFPGAMTPTEIYQAWKWGATMVKVFPAGRLGPGYLKDVLEPLNSVKLVPTGGVNPDNFTEFLRMGASGVGMASALFPKDLIAADNKEALLSFYNNIAGQYTRFKNENK